MEPSYSLITIRSVRNEGNREGIVENQANIFLFFSNP